MALFTQSDCRPDGGSDAASWTRRAMASTRRRHYPKAIESFDHALECEPGSVEALLGRGNALYALDRFDEALETYERALEIAPERPALHLARSNALVALGRKEEAVAAYDRAMALRRPHQ